MTKQQLAQKRNYFKFVLTGMFRKLDLSALTEWEQEEWATIFNIRDELMDKFEGNSRLMGLNIPEHRCWCGKEGKYDIPENYPYKTTAQKFCKKHFKEK